MLGLPAVASAGTKVVYAGPPAVTNQIAGKVIAASGLNPKSFVSKYQPDVNDFFLHRVTINAGDTVSFRLEGFHTVDLPGQQRHGPAVDRSGADRARRQGRGWQPILV